MVKSAHREMLKGDILPARQRELQTQLTALLGNVNEEIREADALYASVLLDIMTTEQKANRARIVAETTPAFHRKREARDTKELIVEMLRTLRQNMRSMSDELRMGAA
jgi:hypothetical protein